MIERQITYDVVSFGETVLRLSPSGGARLEEACTLAVHVAGSESNVMACLSHLGLRCAWLTALPANPLGRLVAAELRRHRVDTSRVVWSGENARLGTFYAEELPAPLGTRVYYDRAGSACALVDPERIDTSIIGETRLVHLTGITPALSGSSREVFGVLLSTARAAGVPVSFDVNYRARLWDPSEAATCLQGVCETATLLFCTRADAADLWGMTGGPESVLQQMAERFGSERKTIVLTLGADGAA